MHSVLAGLAAILTVFGLIFRFIDQSMTADNKENLKARVLALAEEIDSGTPTAIVHFPCQALSFILRSVFGEHGAWRISTTTLLLTVSALGILGIQEGNYFGFEEGPWVTFEEVFRHGEHGISPTPQAESTNQCREPSDDYKLPPDDESIKRYSAMFHSAVHAPYAKWVYTALLFSLIVLSVGASSVIALRFGRRVLLSLMATDDPLLIAGAFLLTFLHAIALSSCVILPVASLTAPIVWLPLIGAVLSALASVPFAVAALLGTIGVCWQVGSDWLRVVAISSVAPSLLVMLSAVAALVLVPIQDRIRAIVLWALRRTAQHETGVAAIAATTAIILAGIVAQLSKLISLE